MTLTSISVLLVTLVVSPLRSMSTVGRPIGGASGVTAYTSCVPASLFAPAFGGAAWALTLPTASALIANAVKRFIENSCRSIVLGSKAHDMMDRVTEKSNAG